MPVPNEPKPPVQGGQNVAAERQKKIDAQEAKDKEKNDQEGSK